MSVSCLGDPESVTVQRAQPPEGAPVLVVEDEADLAEEIRLELEANGHPVRLAATAAEGLEAARAGWASVFVFDRMLRATMGCRSLRPCGTKATRLRSW